MENYYEILGIATKAKPTEIKSAFKKLAHKFHPDKNPNNPAAEARFKQINEAYQTLNNENKRWSYDQKLNSSQNQPIKEPQPKTDKFSTQGNATSYNKYNWSDANTAAGDYSNQGKYYQEPAPKRTERVSDTYILGITLFIIIATAALLFGFMMNYIAAKDHFKKAISHVEDVDYPKALTELDLAIEFKDDFVEAYILKGDIYVKLNRYQSALAAYNKAVKYSKNPDQELIIKRNMCTKTMNKEEEF